MASVANAKIEWTMLGRENHGIPTAQVGTSEGSTAQGFGGYDMRHESAREFCFHVIDVVGVESWEKLPGSMCRVERESKMGRITAVGHIMEDKWLDLPEQGAPRRRN